MSKADVVQKFLIDMRALGLPDPDTEYRFHTQRMYRFDFAWLPQKIAVEIDGGTWIGGRHTSGAGFERDCRKMNLAVLNGWRVLRFTMSMLRDGTAIETVEEALR